MAKIKSKVRLGQVFYVLAIVLLLINIYQKTIDTENRIIEIAAWSSLFLASVYGIWLANEKKKLGDDKE